MPNRQFVLNITFILFTLVALVGVCIGQNSKKEKDSAMAAQISLLVEDQRYFFMAETATPSKGGVRQIGSGYYLKVTKDTVASDLPYFGRAFTASYSGSEGGIKFTSTDFEYKIKPAKKGGWNITIRPKEQNSCREMNLTIFNDGTANLNVSPQDKTPIQFRGYISETRK